MRLNRKNVIAGTVGTLLLGTIMPGASASPPTDLKITSLATGTLDQPLQVKNDGIRLRSKAATDIRMQTITLAVGGKTGWHHHPGLVLVVVESGSVTVWEADCTSTTYGPNEAAGAVFTEGGDESQEVTSASGGRVYATFVVPHADPAVFRIEDPAQSCT